MSLGNKKPWLTRFRLSAALVIGSFLVAALYAICQAQDDSCWASGYHGHYARIRLVTGSLVVFLFTLIVLTAIVRAWRHLPASRKLRAWFGFVSLMAAIVWSSFLFWLNTERGKLYSISETLELVLIWTLVFLTGLLFLYSLKGFFRWLFSWRIVKRGLLGLLLLAGLMVLFRAEENWRGRRAWNQCRQALEAQGEKLDFAAFIPPPVPDEDNFAMAPVVVTAYDAKLDKNGQLENGKYISRRGPLDMDLARTNYSFPTNVTVGSWEKTRLTDLKSWQDYYRATALTNIWNCDNGPTNMEIILLETNEFPVAAQPQAPAADVLLALSRYEWILQELHKASVRPASRFPLNYQATNPAGILLMHLPRLKYSAQVLQLRSIAELQAGQTTQALADVKLILRLADSIRSEPFLISHLVRANLLNMAGQPIWEGLAENRWSDAELQALIKELRRFDFATDWQFAVRGERAYTLPMIDFMGQHRDRMSVYLLLAMAPFPLQWLDGCGNYFPNQPGFWEDFTYSMDRWLAEKQVYKCLFHLPPNGWYDQNKAVLAGAYQERMLPIAMPEQHLISQSASTNLVAWIKTELRTQKPHPQNALLYLFLYTLDRASQRFAQAQNAADMALLACALERYRLAHNEYPDSLSALVPQYLEKISPDVVNGQPLHYRRTDNGRFQLYSIGWNGQDDGGKAEVTRDEWFSIQTGDWVWQYPAILKPN